MSQDSVYAFRYQVNEASEGRWGYPSTVGNITLGQTVGTLLNTTKLLIIFQDYKDETVSVFLLNNTNCLTYVELPLVGKLKLK